MSLKNTINAALSNGTGRMVTDNLAYVNGMFYNAIKGGNFRRAKAQRELHRKHGIARPVPVAAKPEPLVKAIIAPPAAGFSRRAWMRDFVQHAKRNAPAPSLVVK